jgi:hypothetical protein
LTEEEKNEMKSTTYIFKQVLDVLKLVDLRKIASDCGVDKYYKKYNSITHLKILIYAQLASTGSLREIENGLEAQGNLKSLGIYTIPNRSTMSHANREMSSEFFEKSFYAVSKAVQAQCHNPLGGLKRKVKFKAPLYSIDSTIIDLTLSLYNWALYKQTKGGVKLHTMLENDVFLPVWAYVSNAKDHDQKVLETVDPVRGLPKGAFVVMDRAYNDYAMLNLWNKRGINFVCRAKENMAYEVVEELKVPNPVGRPPSPGKEEKPKSHVVRDQIIRLTGKKSLDNYPGKLRAVTFWVEEDKNSKRNSREMTFFTNNFDYSPVTIADCYACRWQIEAFFKLIKQKLRVKSFLGTNTNAVATQLYCALITAMLLRFLQAMCTRGWCVSHLLGLVRLTLSRHIDLMRFLNRQRPNAPPKPGVPQPVRVAPKPRNRLFPS